MVATSPNCHHVMDGLLYLQLQLDRCTPFVMYLIAFCRNFVQRLQQSLPRVAIGLDATTFFTHCSTRAINLAWERNYVAYVGTRKLRNFRLWNVVLEPLFFTRTPLVTCAHIALFFVGRYVYYNKPNFGGHWCSTIIYCENAHTMGNTTDLGEKKNRRKT